MIRSIIFQTTAKSYSFRNIALTTRFLTSSFSTSTADIIQDSEIFRVPEETQSRVEQICRLRKQNDWEEAGNQCKIFMEGLNVTDLPTKYACPDFTDESFTNVRRGFAVVRCLLENNKKPDAEVVRSLILLSTSHQRWLPALEWFEWLRRENLQNGVQDSQQTVKFIYDELLTNLEQHGLWLMGDVLYEKAIDQGLVPKPMEIANEIDLHDQTVPTAKATVRIAFLDMIRRPKDRNFHDTNEALRLITGMGNRSEDNIAKIKPAIETVLKDELKVNFNEAKNNPGCLVLSSKSLMQWAQQVQRR